LGRFRPFLGVDGLDPGQGFARGFVGQNVETGKRNPSYASPRRLAAGLDVSAS
jgi:hypothetical protein